MIPLKHRASEDNALPLTVSQDSEQEVLFGQAVTWSAVWKVRAGPWQQGSPLWQISEQRTLAFLPAT